MLLILLCKVLFGKFLLNVFIVYVNISRKNGGHRIKFRQMKTMRPNIIFVFSDQQRWDTLGCYGQRLNVTPNLDSLAAGGVRFAQTFTCQPVCGPARACLQTGKYATETGCFRNGIGLPAREQTLAHWFSEAGYEVGYLGKWHLASTMSFGNHVVAEQDYETKPIPPERRGGYKDFWLAADVIEHTSHSEGGHLFNAAMQPVNFSGYRVDCLTDFAITHLRNRSRTRPLFFFISYLEPHQQNDRERFEGPAGSKERFARFDVPGDLADTAGDWREQYPDYLGCCASLDANVGRLRSELERLDMLENTILVYTSDHGCHFKTRNSEYKRSCHDGGIRIPLIISGPRFAGGKVINELVSLIDLPPTLLAMAGIVRPPSMRGRPLQELLAGPVPDWPKEVFVQISEDHIGRAIRTRRWKYCLRGPGKEPWSGCQSPGSAVYVEDCLYDLERDPHERHNLIRDPAYAGARRELAAVLKRRMIAIGEALPEVVSL